MSEVHLDFRRFVKQHFKTIGNFSRVLGISRPTANMILDCPTKLRVSDVKKICDITDVTREELWKIISTIKTRVNAEA